MKHPTLLAFAVLTLALACEGNQSPTAPIAPTNSSKIIQDGAHGGNKDFFFLPPMVPLPIRNPDFELGKFNNALRPSLRIEICELNGDNLKTGGLPTDLTTCGVIKKTFAPGTVQLVNLPLVNKGWWTLFGLPADGFYYALWDTRSSNLNVSKYYRIKVFVDGQTDPLGVADVDPMANLSQWKYSLTGDVIQLVDDVMLPITFRVERGALCNGGTCNSATISNSSPALSQSVTVDAGGGSIAGAKFPNGWLPSGSQCPSEGGCPQSVVVTITEIIPSPGVPCHATLDPRLTQFRGCFSYTTTPALSSFNNAGDQFAQPVTIAVCYELQGTGDPREKFAELYASDVNEPPHALPDVVDGGLLGVTTKDCSRPVVIGMGSSNPLVQLASSGWRSLKSGINKVFGVQTAYAVDLGLGGIVKKFSHISPVLPATAQPYTFESVTLGGDQTSTISKVKIVGNHVHTGEGSFAGIDSVPVTFSVAPNNGTLTTVGGTGTATSVTLKTQTDAGPPLTEGIAAIKWTPPTAPGTYSMSAMAPAVGAPIVFTATVPTPVAFQAWSGAATNLSTSVVTFGGSPYCVYTVQFTNMNVSLDLNTSGGGTAGVSATQVEQLATPPCGDIQPNAPHNDQYTSTSVTRVGNVINATLAPVGNLVAATLTFAGTMATDQQSVTGTFTWHRTDQPSPLDWTVTGTFTLAKNAPPGIGNPVLAFTGSEFYSTASGNFVRYNLAVTNYTVYPAELFAPRPDLPPCGLSTSASRTWVDIYNATTNARIYGFCGLGSPSDLLSIWFAEPSGTAAPAQVYIKLTDRATGTIYTSNNVTPLPPP